MSPLPSIEALGRYARQLSDAQHAFDVTGDSKTEAASTMAYWREDAVQQLILTLQPQSLGDAVVLLNLVMNELDDLQASAHSQHDVELVLAKVRRALAGLLPVIIEAARVNATELVDSFFLEQGPLIFDPLNNQFATKRCS